MQVTIDGVHYVPASSASSRIGIAISTHNRSDVLKRALSQHMQFLPAGALVDHADGEPIERHPDSAPRTERRRAWRLA